MGFNPKMVRQEKQWIVTREKWWFHSERIDLYGFRVDI